MLFFSYRSEVRDLRRRVFVEHARHSKRVKAPAVERFGAASEVVRPFEQFFVADCEEWAAQRRKHRQLIVRPLDGRQRGAQRLDFFALVEGASANEHVRNAARFERLDLYGRVTSDSQLTKRLKSRQICLAETLTGGAPLRSVTCQLLVLMIQSTIAPTAAGSDCSIARPVT